MKTKVRIALIVTLVGLLLFSMLGEKVAMNNGAGWDGNIYREIARNFSDQIFNGSYDSYRIQRVLPFALVNLAFNALGIEKTDNNLMDGIQVLNFAAILLCVYLFFRIARKMELSIKVKCLTFIFLFFNFPILKFIGYYPFLTDTYAYLLGFLLFDFYIEDNKAGLVLSAFIGAFTWPVALISSLMLLCFPKGEINLIDDKPLSPKSQIVLNIFKGGVILAPALYVLIFIFRRNIYDIEALRPWFEHAATPSNYFMFILSLLSLSLYTYLVIRPVKFDILKEAGNYLKANYKFLLIFIALYLITSKCVNLVSNGTVGALDIRGMLKGNFVYSTTDPMIFLVNYFLYYGFSIVFIIFFWKQILKYLTHLGVGYILVFSLALFFSFRAECRIGIMFYPLVILPLASCLNKYNINTKFIVLCAISSLVFSRFWFHINTTGIEEAFAIAINDKYHYLNFPAQRYFMNFAHWQDHWVYYLFGSIFVLSIVLYLMFKNKILNITDMGVGMPKDFLSDE